MRYILAIFLLAALAPAQAEWQWQRTPVPLALVVDGIWYESFHVDAALDRAGMRQRDEFKDLSRYSVIVLVNAHVVRLPKDSLPLIRDFVSNGGGLVVLGGFGAYDNGGYADTPLEEILPVSLKDSYIDAYVTAENGAKLTRADSADWPLKFDFHANPLAYYFHTLTPKPGAKVQVKVGDQPAFVSGTFGKGRVVACSLTVNGNPPTGALPFWEWKDWPALLGQAIDWAGAVRPAGVVVEPIPESGLKPLTVDELQGALPKDFAKRAALVPDEKTAQILLDWAVPPTNGHAKCGLEVVLPAVLPHAKPEWGARFVALAAPTNANLETRKAALTLLGACHGPAAYATLSEALKDKKTELAAMDGLGLLGDREIIPNLKARFEEVMKPAKLPDGPDRWEPILFSEACPTASHALIALYRLGDPAAIAQLSDLFRNLMLFDQVMWDDSWRSTPARLHAQLLDTVWEFIEGNIGPIPAKQGDAFVNYALSAIDPVVVEFLADTMEKSLRQPPKADWQKLAGAKSGIIAKMGQALSNSTK